VEADGSAHAEVPALRGLQFIALDRDGRGIKRMHTATHLMPGEALSCVGCHEPRTEAAYASGMPAALRRPPSRLDREGLPEVIDYPRDVQPVWDRHCLRCHNADKMDGGISLAGDRGAFFSHSIVSLVGLGYHYNVRLSDAQYRLVLRWIDVGTPFAGTCASDGTGLVRIEVSPALLRTRCASCHDGDSHASLLKPERLARLKENSNQRRLEWKDPLVNDVLFNFTSPEKSLVLRAPLRKDAGGWDGARPRTDRRRPCSPAPATPVTGPSWGPSRMPAPG
jgi:hypothetical protein